MINKKGAITLLVLVVIAYLFEFNNMPHKYILKTNNNLKADFQKYTTKTTQLIQEHMNQMKIIKKLKEENLKLKKEILSKNALLKTNITLLNDLEDSDIKTILKINKDKNITSKNFEYVEVISYVNLNNKFRFFINSKLKADKIYGLIYKNYAVGIATRIDNKSVVFLNGDSKCKYTVFIGKNKVSAIFGSKISYDGLIEANYIPLWQKVKVGDEVITSGLDNYFYEGYKVGKVVKLNSYETYKVALVKPYVQANNKKNFFLIRKGNK